MVPPSVLQFKKILHHPVNLSFGIFFKSFPLNTTDVLRFSKNKKAGMLCSAKTLILLDSDLLSKGVHMVCDRSSAISDNSSECLLVEGK